MRLRHRRRRGVRLAVVRGELDDIVPAQFAVPTPIGDVTVVDIADEDHFDLIDPAIAIVGRSDRLVAALGGEQRVHLADGRRHAFVHSHIDHLIHVAGRRRTSSRCP